MLEIKFRAWDNTAKDIGGQRMIGWEELNSLDSDGNLCFMDLITTGWNGNGIPMQYTGSKDSADKDIYDGDIGKDENGNLCRIFWNDDDSGFAADFSDGEMTSVAEAAGCIEVIGNKFDNPDLWEKINAE